MSMTEEEYWKSEARRFESWFYRANYLRTQQEADNVALRELAKQMHICLTRPKVYDVEQPYLTATECPYFTEGACDYNACGFERRMRELGIEVSDGRHRRTACMANAAGRLPDAD